MSYFAHVTAFMILLCIGGGVAYAQDMEYTPLVTIPGVTAVGTGVTLTDYLVNGLMFLVAAAGVLAVIMIVVAGTQYVAAGISPSAKSDAKEQIVNALIGLGIILSSWLLLNTINPNLVNFSLELEKIKSNERLNQNQTILATSTPKSERHDGSFEGRQACNNQRRIIEQERQKKYDEQYPGKRSSTSPFGSERTKLRDHVNGVCLKDTFKSIDMGKDYYFINYPPPPPGFDSLPL